MQFIVIYGTRFIYGGQSRLPRDWEGAGLGEGVASGPWPGRMPIVGAEGFGPSWASLPLPGPLAFRLWLLLSQSPCHLPAFPPPHPQLPTPTEGPELMLSPATSQGLRSRWGGAVPVPGSVTWVVSGWPSRWPLARVGPHQGRRALRQGPNPAGKGGSRIGLGQPGPLSCFGCSPSLVLSSWPQLLKCHFLSGLQWLCLPTPHHSPRPQLASVSGKPKPWLHRTAL